MFVPRLVGLMVGWMEDPMEGGGLGPWHSAASGAPLQPPLPSDGRTLSYRRPSGRPSAPSSPLKSEIHYGISFESRRKKVGFGKQSAQGILGLCLSPQISCRWVFHLYVTPNFLCLSKFKATLSNNSMKAMVQSRRPKKYL